MLYPLVIQKNELDQYRLAVMTPLSTIPLEEFASGYESNWLSVAFEEKIAAHHNVYYSYHSAKAMKDTLENRAKQLQQKNTWKDVEEPPV